METIMKIHADGFPTDMLKCKTDIGATMTRQVEKRHPTMCWQLRDGVLVQVWREAERVADGAEAYRGLTYGLSCDREAA